MNITEIINYVKSLAVSHKSIKHTDAKPHFFEDINIATEQLKSRGHMPAIIMGPPIFVPYDKRADNTQEVNTVVMLIVEKGQKLTAYDKCKSIAIDFITKIKKDEHEQNSILAFDPESATIELIGPVLDEFYGVELMLEFNTELDLEYDQSKWDE